MDYIDLILNAKRAEEVFSSSDHISEMRKLQRSVHPDLNPTRVEDATAAFVKLSKFYAVITGTDATLIETKRNSWCVTGDIWKSVGVRYRSLKNTTDQWMVYVATARATGRFLEGHRALDAVLNGVTEDDAANGTTNAYYFPRTLDKFKLGEDKREARILTANLPDSRWYPLSAWPTVDPKDLAWIARRVLVALDLTHRQGYLHGSPHLNAMLVEPHQHGVMLKDWQYAVRFNDPLTLIDGAAKDAYPSNAKEPGATADGTIDLHVAGHAFLKLALSGGAPDWMVEYFRMLSKHPPKSAVIALEKLTQMIDKHWPRKFHVMEAPPA